MNDSRVLLTNNTHLLHLSCSYGVFLNKDHTDQFERWLLAEHVQKNAHTLGAKDYPDNASLDDVEEWVLQRKKRVSHFLMHGHAGSREEMADAAASLRFLINLTNSLHNDPAAYYAHGLVAPEPETARLLIEAAQDLADQAL